MEGRAELYSTTFKGGTPTRISPTPVAGGHVSSFRIAPDSTRVAFKGDLETDNDSELYSVPIAGGTVSKLNRPLVEHGDVGDWRLAGSTAVYMLDTSPTTGPDLYSVPIGGGTSTMLNRPLAAGSEVYDELAFTDDMHRVIYPERDAEGVFEYWASPVAGGGATKLNGVPGTLLEVRDALPAGSDKAVIILNETVIGEDVQLDVADLAPRCGGSEEHT